MSIAVLVAALSIVVGFFIAYFYYTKMSAPEQPVAQPPEPQQVEKVREEKEVEAAADETATAIAAAAAAAAAAPPPSSDTAAEAQPSASAKPKNKANSYYYWHGHEKERAKLGDVAPMPTPHLVSKDDSPSVAVPVVPTVSVSKYSWCDGDKFVSVYVATAPPASGETLEEESVAVSFTRNSFKLSFATVDAAGKRQAKQMTMRLSKRIDAERSSTKLKPKTQEILVKLAKKVPSVWMDLEGNASDRDSADDEALEKDDE